MMKYVKALIILVTVVCIGFIFGNFYSYIFSRNVEGVIDNVERVQLNIALVQTTGTDINPQMYSFSVGIKEKSGEIVTASAEDRQWAVATKGLCVKAKFFPYPPWDLNKAGTYHNARLIQLWECGAEGKSN